MLLALAASAQTYVPGTSYFGRSNYIEYIAGNLPIIISEPHDGTLTPSEIPNRTYGTFARDLYAEPLARAIKTNLFKLTGRYPHVIMCRLDRDNGAGDARRPRGIRDTLTGIAGTDRPDAAPALGI